MNKSKCCNAEIKICECSGDCFKCSKCKMRCDIFLSDEGKCEEKKVMVCEYCHQDTCWNGDYPCKYANNSELEYKGKEIKLALNVKGQCPFCDKKPLIYKKDQLYFCTRCDRAFDLSTKMMIENYFWNADNTRKDHQPTPAQKSDDSSQGGLEAHVHPKVSNPLKMLDQMYELTYQMQKYIFLAMLAKEEEKRDGYINKIIDLNEEIEKLYSTNWH